MFTPPPPTNHKNTTICLVGMYGIHKSINSKYIEAILYFSDTLYVKYETENVKP